MRKPDRSEQKGQAVMAMLIIVSLVLMTQIWLLSIAVEGWQSAHSEYIKPTLLASAFCFGINCIAYYYLVSLDRRS